MYTYGWIAYLISNCFREERLSLIYSLSHAWLVVWTQAYSVAWQHGLERPQKGVATSDGI